MSALPTTPPPGISTRDVQRQVGTHRVFPAFAAMAVAMLLPNAVRGEPLQAGVAKVDITNTDAGPVNDPLYAKALVLKSDSTTGVIVTVDAVAIAEIGSIRNDFLANVRAPLEKDPGLKPASIMINASHCHGIVCGDVEQRTVQAVKQPWKNLVPVKVGAGTRTRLSCIRIGIEQ